MEIKALTFDTGGTILDWHDGLCGAFERIGKRHGAKRDWHAVTNDYRRWPCRGLWVRPSPHSTWTTYTARCWTRC